jgi:hypothetical protein
VELEDCRVAEDPASPIQAGGYIVACVAFYEWGFGVVSHRFLHSLLQFYGLELHYLTPLGILHMAAFVSLCEANMGTEPHFNLWNYILSHLATIGLERGNGDLGQYGHLCPIWAWS